MELSASKAIMGAWLALLLCVSGTSARADAIPYPTPGVLNPAVYNFTAVATGDIIAYFAGSTASFENLLGMQVNGGPVGSFGLNNHTSAIGDSFNLGSVTAGDVVTFVMRNTSPGIGDAFSDPALNGPYDFAAAGAGIQHVYATNYTVTSPIIGAIGAIPAGIYVGWEDIPSNNPQFPFIPDFDYDDLTFVFTNTSIVVPAPIAGAGLPGLILACGGLLALARRRRKLVV
jgi:hypothetical protein